jgi:1-acyl-sn-glycerol-3-phosphate acyltransferase
MALVGTYEIVPMNSFHVHPGRVQLIIGEPIPTDGMRVRDVEKLSGMVRQAIGDIYYARSAKEPKAEEIKPVLAPRSKGSPDALSS